MDIEYYFLIAFFLVSCGFGMDMGAFAGLIIMGVGFFIIGIFKSISK